MGFILGLNYSDFQLTGVDNLNQLNIDTVQSVSVKNHAGFHIGILANYRLNDRIVFQFNPGIFFTQRDLVYSQITETKIIEIESIFAEFPILCKFSILPEKKRNPYLISGILYRFEMAGKDIISEHTKRDNELWLKNRIFILNLV